MTNVTISGIIAFIYQNLFKPPFALLFHNFLVLLIAQRLKNHLLDLGVHERLSALNISARSCKRQVGIIWSPKLAASLGQGPQDVNALIIGEVN